VHLVTLEKFKFLVNGGEKPNVDFKISCNAFNKSAGDQLKAKAELVKDICAMANNGAIASYLIIGVSDDAKAAQPISDPHLTEQNIQTLVRDAIHPRPIVRVQKVRWPNAPRPFKGVDLMIIQIGPNAKHAFRFAQDRVDWNARFHFRKNEVWVRNGSTSDLATPEQIAIFLSAKRTRTLALPITGGTSYLKLGKTEQLKALSNDARNLFTEFGATIGSIKEGENSLNHDFRISLRIQKRFFVFRCCFVDALPKDGIVYRASRRWGLEHGLIFFSIGSAPAVSKSYGLNVAFEESWGGFAMIESRRLGARPIPGDVFGRDHYDWPSRFRKLSIPIVTLQKIDNTQKLRARITQCLEGLQSDEVLFKYVDTARRQLNEKIRPSMRAGWNANADRDFNREAAPKVRRCLQDVSKLAIPSRGKTA
jgi:hypothetical protein